MPTTPSNTDETAAPEPVVYDFLRSFLDSMIQMGHTEDDAAKIFDFFFSRGYVFKTPHWIMLGGDDPSRPEDHTCWYVVWAEVHPDFKLGLHPFSTVAHFLSLMPHYRPYIRFGRGLKGIETRTYKTDTLLRLVSKANKPHSHGLRT
jgi:hypothetical protein